MLEQLKISILSSILYQNHSPLFTRVTTPPSAGGRRGQSGRPPRLCSQMALDLVSKILVSGSRSEISTIRRNSSFSNLLEDCTISIEDLRRFGFELRNETLGYMLKAVGISSKHPLEDSFREIDEQHAIIVR